MGSRFRCGPPNPDQPWTTIIGVVGNVRNSPTALRPEPMMFHSLRQQPFGENVRGEDVGRPFASTSAVRGALRAIDPGLPMYQVATMQNVVDKGYRRATPAGAADDRLWRAGAAGGVGRHLRDVRHHGDAPANGSSACASRSARAEARSRDW